MAEIGKNLQIASELLNQGEVIAIPTETVYGLAGNALHADTVKKIYQIKGRPENNPLIIHLPDFDQFEKYVRNIPQNALRLAEKFWPGPMTLLLEKTALIPDQTTASLPRVAVRIPNHPLTLSLLNMLDYPLAAPSANPYGYISPTSAVQVKEQLGDKIRYILDGGPCQKGIESTIIGFDGEIPVIYRKGFITPSDVETVCSEVKIHENRDQEIITSGMSLSHYAPKTPVFLTKHIENFQDHFPVEHTGILAFTTCHPLVPREFQRILSPSGDLAEAAKNLYLAMYELDTMKLDRIVAEFLPDVGIGMAINDRLTRAANQIIS